MKKVFILFIACLAGAVVSAQVPFTKAATKEVMKKVADWQMAHPNKESEHDDLDWTHAALYMGMIDWAELTEREDGDETYYQWLLKIGRRNQFQMGKWMYHADFIAVAHPFIDLYKKYGQEKMVMPVLARANWVVEHPAKTTLDLDYGNLETLDRWSWCDALFMAPPVYAKLYALTGEKKYIRFMNEEYKATYDYLFDKEEQLFYRDRRYFGKKEANGKKVFWGRGNGWVLGGLAEDVYSTHGLGPVAQALDIHRGDRMKTLVAMDTKSVVGKVLVEERIGEVCNNFRNGDHTTTLIRTENGKVIEIQHNVMTPQPYNRLYQLTGTKGFANKYPVQGYALDAKQMTASGVQPKLDDLNAHGFLPKEDMNALVAKFQHPILKKYGEMAKEVGGHGGMDFIMDSRLIYCLQNGLPLDLDVYDMAEWCCLAELGELSMDNNCAAVAFPDFTRGEWNKVQGYKFAYATPEDEAEAMEKAKAFTLKLKEKGAKEWADNK